MRKPDVGWGGTGRRRIGHVAGVDLVEPGEVVDVGVEDPIGAVSLVVTALTQ